MVGLQRADLSFRSVNLPGMAGYAPGLQRHHILPCQLLSNRAVAGMLCSLGSARIGFHDFRRNGLLLPSTEAGAARIGLPMHRGPHRHYNEMVLERVGQISSVWDKARHTMADRADHDALARMDRLQRALRLRLLDPRRWHGNLLSRHDPALDFSHLDRMADMLWTETELPSC
jgi:hypothetical protein